MNSPGVEITCLRCKQRGSRVHREGRSIEDRGAGEREGGGEGAEQREGGKGVTESSVGGKGIEEKEGGGEGTG